MKQKILKIILVPGLAGALAGCAASIPPPEDRASNYSLSRAERIPIAAQHTTLPLTLFGEEYARRSLYVPSGFMGDTDSLKMTSSDDSAPLDSGKPGQNSLRVSYSGKGKDGWAGVYWLTPANNWGKIKGAGYDLTKAGKLTFWLRGENGGERLSQIKMGGIIGPYPDTDEASMGPVKLTTEWHQYALDLRGKDLRHIVGGFAFIIRRTENPRGATFYLDEIKFEPLPVSSSTVVQQQWNTSAATVTVSESTPIAAATPVPALKQPVHYVIPFSGAKLAFQAQSKADLDAIVQMAASYPTTRVMVEGHTDNVGPVDMNARLSLERANAVAEYLEAAGLEPARIVVRGLGSEHPLSPDSNLTEQGRKKNRRVEVTIME